MDTETLEELLLRVRSCSRCAGALPLGPRPVLQAHARARILIVGQAPGRRVHETGIAFNDPSGDRLRDWMGVDRATFYDEKRVALVPMGFCYPGTGRSGDLPPRAECAPAWRESLLARLPGIELTIALGQYALAWHLGGAGRGGVTQAVREWRNAAPGILPLPHPSPRNNLWLRRNPWFAEELLPALRERVAEVLRA